MIVIAGLGNPGKEYEKTRHNAGFEVIGRLADSMGIDVSANKVGGLIGKGVMGGQKVLLVKPMTYMNCSGECIRAVLDYYHLEAKDSLVVIYDDISLPPGEIRIRQKGSAGGHNGIKNIIAHLHSDQFCRIKVGVGEKPSGGDLVNHVLGHFSRSDREKMEEGYDKALKALPVIVSGDVQRAMNEFNKRKKEQNDEV